jgi:RNA polymerase sigma-70 factor (sigma-E family)
MMTDVGVQHDSGGSVDALAAVYREHYATLVGLARLLLDERGLAEEVVQEAFARTYAAWPRLRTPDDPLPYVRRAVVNLARGGLRRRIVARRATVAPAADAPSAEDGVLAAARDREVADAVRALPRRQRECVVLRYFLECSTAQTADALGVSDGTVKQHLHRALAALGVALEDHAQEHAEEDV